MDIAARLVAMTEQLLSYKKSDTLIVLGNGPSATSCIKHIIKEKQRVDVSGTAMLALSGLDPNFMFFEPEGCGRPVTHSGLDLSLYLGYQVLRHEALHALDNRTTCIIVNPAPEYTHFGYFEEPVGAVAPNWFYVDESSCTSITHSLQDFFLNGHSNNKVLNFRGSVVRQISLGFLLGYNNIVLSGIDPSDPCYWIGKTSSRDIISPMLFGRVEQIVSKINPMIMGVRGASLDESFLIHEPSPIPYEFTWSIFHVAAMYSCLSQSQTRFAYVGDDTYSLECFSTAFPVRKLNSARAFADFSAELYNWML